MHINSTAQQKEFEKAILKGDIHLVNQSLSNGCSLDKPLPSGELPLHLAVRSNQPRLTELFINRGANPLQRDIQRMQALDHASLSSNPLHKALILGLATDNRDVSKIQRQMQCKLHDSDTKLKNKINFYKTVGLSPFSPPLGKAVFQGNLLNINRNNINQLDSKGLAPIHYAILGNQVGAIQELIALGADLKILGPDQDSLLHIASMRNINPAILQLLLGMGLDPNAKNDQKQNPLHFAAIEDNLIAIRLLSQAGAISSLSDAQGVTPFALVGSFVSDRDPLKLSLSDFLYPALIGSVLLAPIALQNGWIHPETLLNTSNIVQTVNTYLPKALLAYAGVQMFLPSPPQERTGIYSNGSLLDLGAFIALTLFPDALPTWCKTGLTIWNTYKILRNTQQGLQTCYQNIGYRNPIKIGTKALLHSLSITPTLIMIQQNISSYFQNKSLEYLLKEVSESLAAYKKSPDSNESKRKAAENLFEYYAKLGKKPNDIKGNSAETDLWANIQKDLTEQDLKKLWRAWSLTKHPDKIKDRRTVIDDDNSIFAAGNTIHECLVEKLKGSFCASEFGNLGKEKPA
jgi:ankyrin repeat protein